MTETAQVARCACCGRAPQRPGELTCTQCAGYEDRALDCPHHTTPVLIHSGTYALYETPDGGRHLVYRRAQSLHEDGHMREISDAQDEHLPDIPPAALPLISSFLENGFPPAVLAMLSGKVSPLKMLGAVKDAMTNGAG